MSLAILAAFVLAQEHGLRLSQFGHRPFKRVGLHHTALNLPTRAGKRGSRKTGRKILGFCGRCESQVNLTNATVTFIGGGGTGAAASAVLNGANTFSNTSNYSWVIARVNQPYSAGTSQQLLASLSLNTAGLPAAASGYQYFLSAQTDPSAADTDLVVNYAPAPEPTGLLLLGLGAAPLLRRRRKASPGRQIA